MAELHLTPEQEAQAQALFLRLKTAFEEMRHGHLLGKIPLTLPAQLLNYQELFLLSPQGGERREWWWIFRGIGRTRARRSNPTPVAGELGPARPAPPGR